MNDKKNTHKPWEPPPIPAADFHQDDAHSNINRAPYDQVAGVTFKRALNIKRIAYPPGHIVRWLFSEQTTTAEDLLEGATFTFLHDLRLPSGTHTEEKSHSGETHLLYTIAGTGWLYHRPTDGSPTLSRPLRPGDAALIRGTERYWLANTEPDELVLLIVGLK